MLLTERGRLCTHRLTLTAADVATIATISQTIVDNRHRPT